MGLAYFWGQVELTYSYEDELRDGDGWWSTLPAHPGLAKNIAPDGGPGSDIT